ncbi:MAG TPA: tetratricopeptide repeat protein [Pyrinomonadaceae bacterium]|nr:tetratricopeptide repeat protein [Pyrinomonadaceae bacterium]
MKRILIIRASCVAALFLSSCGGNEPKLISNQTTVANSNAQSSGGAGSQGVAPSRASSSAPAKSGGGDYIDTSAYDAKIKGLEEQSKKKPDDAAVRKQLAQAYLERGNALTGARQYQAALGDYRRTLRYDPSSEEARYWSDTIVGILKQMNRPVPEEGSEPAPLPKT